MGMPCVLGVSPGGMRTTSESAIQAPPSAPRPSTPANTAKANTRGLTGFQRSRRLRAAAEPLGPIRPPRKSRRPARMAAMTPAAHGTAGSSLRLTMASTPQTVWPQTVMARATAAARPKTPVCLMSFDMSGSPFKDEANLIGRRAEVFAAALRRAWEKLAALVNQPQPREQALEARLAPQRVHVRQPGRHHQQRIVTVGRRFERVHGLVRLARLGAQHAEVGEPPGQQHLLALEQVAGRAGQRLKPLVAIDRG